MNQARHTGLLAFFVKHPTAANLLMVLMLLAGIVGMWQMHTQFFPKIERPIIRVSIAWPGAAAEDIAQNILTASENAVRYLDNVRQVRSQARQGFGQMDIEYEADTDMKEAKAEVDQAMSALTTLPEDSEDPAIRQTGWYDQIATIVLSGPMQEAALKQYAYQIRDDLLALGIDRVTFNGLRDEEIWVKVSPRKLAQLDVSLSDIAHRVDAASIDLPAGSVSSNIERQLRALSDLKTAPELEDVEIRANASGNLIRLGDIAEVSTQFDRDQSAAFDQGDRAIMIQTWRTANTDSLESARIVEHYVAVSAQKFPKSLEIKLHGVRAKHLRARIDLLINNGLTGLALVLVILFVFLSARIALWVAVGIPVALMIAMAVMWASGQTINMVSVFALILTLGIIVDDAIVVGEHAQALSRRGHTPLDAALLGAQRMAIPVLAAIITTQIAFLPILLVRGDIGQISSPMPVVVVAVLAASLVEAFLILPAHLRHGLTKSADNSSRFRIWFDRGFSQFRDHYFAQASTLSYDSRYVCVALSIAILLGSAGLLDGGRVKFQLFPSPEPERITAGIYFGSGTPDGQIKEILTKVEQALYRAQTDLTGDQEPVVRSAVAFLGGHYGRRSDSFSSILVQISPSEDRDITTAELVKAWRQEIGPLAGVDHLALTAGRSGPSGQEIEVELKGDDAYQLKQAAQELRGALARFAGVSAITDDQAYGKPELVFSLTPRGATMGFSLDLVGAQLRHAFEGIIARRFARGEDEITVRVLHSDDARSDAALRELILRSPSGIEVPLLEVVKVTNQQGFSTIKRVDGHTTITVSADIDHQQTNALDVLEALKTDIMPPIAKRYGLRFEFSGRDRQRKEAFADIGFGALLAGSAIYLLLALVFANYFAPIVVMAIIPFGIVGAIVGHYALGFPLTIMSVLGLLGLSGILVNDSIILVMRAAERRQDGNTMRDAAIGASCDRLRAVLLTSLTTIGGLLPLLFEKSLQAQFLIPVAITLVFGLALATFLVLFLAPALLGIGHDFYRIYLQIRHRLGGPLLPQL